MMFIVVNVSPLIDLVKYLSVKCSLTKNIFSKNSFLVIFSMNIGPGEKEIWNSKLMVGFNAHHTRWGLENLSD